MNIFFINLIVDKELNKHKIINFEFNYSNDLFMIENAYLKCANVDIYCYNNKSTKFMYRFVNKFYNIFMK
jgi:hypothetical protein